jgi:hypothetical protein
MREAVHRVVPFAPRGGRRFDRAKGWLLPVLVVLAMLVMLVVALAGQSSQRRGLRALPDEQRLGLLSRTVEELRRSCGEGRPEALRDHCRELASFAAQFEECRGECETLVRRELTPIPTR